MTPTLRRAALTALALVAAAVWCGSPAPAAIDITSGIRYVSPDGSLADCGSKAKSSLESFLQGASEQGSGSGDWIAYSQNGPSGTPTASGIVRCYALPKGYVVTFTCAV
ncbi:MAG: hypothetical protein JO302_07415 [Candidatus Eremiobacteraeota bacterium]|nr:hypothetical protein [Candidatus Eremiobacteraeota bacterium]